MGRAVVVWGGIAEIDRQVPDRWARIALLFFRFVACSESWRRIEWDAARLVALAVVPLGA